MAWYLPVAALALTAVGTGMSVAGAQQSKAETKAAIRAERKRQRGFQDKASAQFAASLAESTPAKAQEQLATAEAERKEAYQSAQKQNIGKPMAVASGGQRTVTEPSSDAVSAEAARAGQGTSAWTKLLNNAAAKGNSYADWGLQQNIKNTRANQNLGLIATGANNSASLLYPEIQMASQSGADMQGWGSGVSGLGSVLGMGAATGAFNSGQTKAPSGTYFDSSGNAYAPGYGRNAWGTISYKY